MIESETFFEEKSVLVYLPPNWVGSKCQIKIAELAVFMKAKFFFKPNIRFQMFKNNSFVLT